jgi:hypothetical protein
MGLTFVLFKEMSLRKLVGILTVLSMALVTATVAGTAQAGVTGCNSVGTVAGYVNYGACSTDQNGGTGSVTWPDTAAEGVPSGHGFIVDMKAKTQRSAEQVASFWQSNGPLEITTPNQICAYTNVTQLSLKGGGYVTQQLFLSYNGAEYPIGSPRQITSTTNNSSALSYCGNVPAGATNVWWQLITIAGGLKPSSQVSVSATLIGVSVGS